MRKINRTDVLKLVLVLAFVAAIGTSLGAIGRFTPTHAIVEPVYCGACHPDQVIELNATTHLPHFAGAIYEEAEAIAAGSSAEITQAEAVSGGCMMCHNTWANREKIFFVGYELAEVNNNSKVTYNDVNVKNTNDAVLYDVPVSLNSGGTQEIRLGTTVTAVKVTVQDPGSSGVDINTPIINTSDGTNVTLDSAADTNLTALNASTGAGTVKITYKVSTGATKSYKDVWGALSALSPRDGFFFNDQTNAASCGNPEKALCHAVETIAGKNMMNQMLENTAGGLGKQSGSGNGIYFRHEMAYTSAEYAAKQVKFCGVCHVNKLPPMTSDGEPIRQNLANNAVVIRVSHGEELLNTSNVTTTSPEWAHRQVQCVRCHGHAGIGSLDEAITGVRSD